MRKPEKIKARSQQPEAVSLLPAVLAFLIHVLDGRFVDHQVGSTIARHLEAALVVPLDDAVDFLAITQHNHHGRFPLHLFLIIEILRVGLLRWCRLAATAIAIVALAGALRSIPPLSSGCG